MGLLLRNKQKKEEWIKILYSDLWELYDRKEVDILPALWLSYFNLRPELKQCFAYCSLFPKDYHFRKGEMVLLWMAEGLLQSTNRKRVEEVGEEYFEDLISMSFFQPSNNDKMESTFLMHDLIHDLAIFVSGEFCYMMNNINKCSHKVRHFSLSQDWKGAYEAKEFEELFKAKCLRTILWHWRQGSINDLLKIEQLDKLFPSLRVLSIEDNRITKLPDSIGNLKYLRYLKLDCGSIKEIPNTICKLYNLKILLLEGCGMVTTLPTDIGNLIKLQHLSVPMKGLVEIPLQLSKLQNLQTLNSFVVGKNKDSAASIKLLKEFQHLHGSLSIKGLQNVSSLEEVSAAALNNFKFLSHLSLEWDYHHYPKVDELHIESDELNIQREVLSALQPHSNLKELTIEKYKGNSFPNWMGDHSCLSNLVSLKMVNCRNCNFLPSLGQLPSLKYLWIRDCGVIEEVVFPDYEKSCVCADYLKLVVFETPPPAEKKGEVERYESHVKERTSR
ncbi:putative disease resistance protein At3g14460 [Cannabis sativa]|uniref:putative disease resistance protein At3g14460 n=1 Tax=Cannabis sativa TaxID=3483 RepID=UPI0029CA65B6|nr:putative disease resistance protein At3g14460 [Cannabis sativa]